MSNTEVSSFQALGLDEPLLKGLQAVGYETPSPIQAQCIPHLLAGYDVLGQAQTGTGKTAAFALPLLARIDLNQRTPQVLVLTPTRELAIQVAEAFQTYARFLKGFQVLPIYGGQEYQGQIKQLKRGAHVIVGTPGRVMDHMRRKTLELDALSTLVLDEADEMLRMGFIEDVEWILQQTPSERQIALFSATLPTVIKRVAKNYLNEPKEVKIAVRTTTADTIRQRFWQVSGLHKLDALTRILETEKFDAMLVFVRTKTATVELAEKLAARGFASEALNGDMPQKQRERTVERLRKGRLDILVATDVAARGLDVDRISHVLNYDIPYDTEAYVHRVGRTGRAGRNGEAILFVAPRERHLLKAIERATRQPIEKMRLPSSADIAQARINRFKQRLSDTLASEDLEHLQQILQDYQQEHAVEPLQIAAALAHMLNSHSHNAGLGISANAAVEEIVEEQTKADKKAAKRPGKKDKAKKRNSNGNGNTGAEIEMERFQIAVGKNHGVKPGNIVGAIANEAGLLGDHIGHIDIHDDHSTVDLPAGMPKDIFRDLKKTWVCGQRLQIFRLDEPAEALLVKTSLSNKAIESKSASKKLRKKKSKVAA